MVNTAPTVTQLYAQAILQAARRRGLTLPAALRDRVVPRQRVPLSVQDQLWEQYCRLTDDPLAGLDIGLALEVGHLDSAGMLLVSCDTLREGFEALVAYAPVIGGGGSFQLAVTGDLMRLSYRPAYRVRVNERVEAVMASLVRLARWATGDAFTPRALWLAHAPLAPTTVYRQRLAMPVHFNSVENRLHFSRAQGALPLIQANPALRDHLQQLVDATMQHLGQRNLSARVTCLVRAHPRWGRERVAAELALSARHMNRLLAAEGLSFKVLRERERHRLALDLLRTGHSVGQTAEQLGFSEETALVRAFRRWQGDTPARFREQQLDKNK